MCFFLWLFFLQCRWNYHGNPQQFHFRRLFHRYLGLKTFICHGFRTCLHLHDFLLPFFQEMIPFQTVLTRLKPPSLVDWWRFANQTCYVWIWNLVQAWSLQKSTWYGHHHFMCFHFFNLRKFFLYGKLCRSDAFKHWFFFCMFLAIGPMELSLSENNNNNNKGPHPCRESCHRFLATLHRTLWWCPLARQEHGRLHTALEDQVGGWRTWSQWGNWGDSNVVQWLPWLKHTRALTKCVSEIERHLSPERNWIDIYSPFISIYVYLYISVFVHKYTFHLQQIDVYILLYRNLHLFLNDLFFHIFTSSP